MKQLIILIFCIFPLLCWAEGTFPQSEYMFPNERKGIYFLDDNKIKFESQYDSGYTSKPFVNNYSGSYNIRIDDLFTYLDIMTESGEKYSLVVHWTKDTIVLTDPDTKEILIGIGLESTPPISMMPHLRSFDALSATSFFTETYGGKTYKYTPDNLRNEDLTTPWVEGVEGLGIGEKLKFYTYDRTRAIVIANGYFDPARPDLYYANNRLKKVLIRTFDEADGTWRYETPWELEDTYNLQSLVIPDLWQYFELEIVEVYKGDKYDDTCIAGLFTHVGLGMYQGQKQPFVVLPQPIEK